MGKARNVLEELGLSREIIKFRAAQTGYCGGAATLLHLDEAVRSNEFKQGDLIVVSAIESSKWMSAGFIITC
ncbi:MAG: 3-oxoacyl-[acyl-carrier-protein] synthase III C-terminal domain-containing protein [Candidatus Anammoxibacter sp.]